MTFVSRLQRQGQLGKEGAGLALKILGGDLVYSWSWGLLSLVSLCLSWFILRLWFDSLARKFPHCMKLTAFQGFKTTVLTAH